MEPATFRLVAQCFNQLRHCVTHVQVMNYTFNVHRSFTNLRNVLYRPLGYELSNYMEDSASWKASLVGAQVVKKF